MTSETLFDEALNVVLASNGKMFSGKQLEKAMDAVLNKKARLVGNTAIIQSASQPGILYKLQAGGA